MLGKIWVDAAEVSDDSRKLLDAVRVGETVTLLLTVADGVMEGLTLLEAVKVGETVALVKGETEPVVLLDAICSTVKGETEPLTLFDGESDTARGSVDFEGEGVDETDVDFVFEYV
jgi:antitoxin (DNA-binding transcriptional repressor) of toxin-antitoxin stability system